MPLRCWFLNPQGVGKSSKQGLQDITKKLATACFYGGTSYRGQIECMRNGTDILIGTSGSIKDHLPVSFSILISSGCIGEGNGNLLQCSCLENPRVGEPGGLPSMGLHRVRRD